MESIISEQTFREIKYSILGKNLQTLNVVLMPSQSLNVDEANVVCSSEGLTKNVVHRPFWGESSKLTPTTCKFINTSPGIAYLSLNRNGGQIATFDLPALQGMIFNETYVLGHTANVSMPRYQKLPKTIKGRHLKAQVIEAEEQSTYVFIQCESSAYLFEKMLEENETMFVKEGCIVALSKSLLVDREKNRESVVPQSVALVGPGRVFLKSKIAAPTEVFHAPRNEPIFSVGVAMVILVYMVLSFLFHNDRLINHKELAKRIFQCTFALRDATFSSNVKNKQIEAYMSWMSQVYINMRSLDQKNLQMIKPKACGVIQYMEQRFEVLEPDQLAMAVKFYSECYSVGMVPNWTEKWGKAKEMVEEDKHKNESNQSLEELFRKCKKERASNLTTLEEIKKKLAQEKMLNASEPLEFLRFLHNLFQNSFSLQPAIAKDLFSFTLARLIELGRNMTVQRLSWILLSLTKMDLDLTWELDKICSLILQQSYYLAPKSILLTLKSFIIPKSGMNLALHKYCHKEAIKLIESSADYNEAFTAAYLCINHELPPHLRADKGTIKRFVKKLNELHKTDERIKIEDGILFQLLQYYPKETKKIKEHFYDPKSKEVMLYLSNFNKRVNKDFSNLRDMIDLAPKDALPYVKQAIIGNTLSRLRKGIQDEELEKYATFYIHNDIDSKTLDLLVNAIIKDRTKVRSIMIILEELIECHRGFSNYKQVLGDVLEAALNPKKINLYHSLSLWFTVNGHKKFQPIADDIWQNIAAKKVSLMDFAEIFNKVNVNKGLLKNKRIFYEKLHPILDFAEEKPFYSISIINAIYYDMLKSKVPLTTITSFYEAACKNIRSPEGIPTAEIVFKGRTLLAQTLYFPSPLKKLFLDHFNLHAVKDPELLRFLCLAAFPEVYEESFSFIPEKLKDYSIVSSAHYAGKDKVKYEKLKEYRDKLVDNLYKLVNTNKLSETMDLLQPLFLDCLEPDPKVSKLIEVLVAHLQVIK